MDDGRPRAGEREPTSPPVAEADRLAAWSALHGGAAPVGVVRGWLLLVHRIAAPLVARRVSPDVVTGLGVLVAAGVPAAAAAGGWWALLAGALAVAVGVLDGLDGAVALLSGRATRWGAVIDSVGDRLGDGLFLLALWLLGAPGWLTVAGWSVTLLLEYLRARAGAVGMTEVGVITVAERPTRVILAALTCLAAAAVPAVLTARSAGEVAGVGAAVWTLVGAVGLVQLTVVSRRLLRARDERSAR